MEERKPDLVPIVPIVFNQFVCPSCGEQQVNGKDLYFPGIHVMATYTCSNCNVVFERDLPIGFANDHPLAVDLKTNELLNTTNAPDWLTTPFEANYHDRKDSEVQVNINVYKQFKEVIILNCNDFLYGHVLLKLYNAQHYLDHHKDKGLIIIAPKMYSWMIPDGIAEYWEVEMGIGKLQKWHNQINAEIQAQLPRFETVHLGRGYSHPEFNKVDIERYIDVSPFPLEEFDERPLHITFVSRTDRLWYRNGVAKFVYRVLRKLGLKDSFGRYYVWAQDKLMKQTISKIKRLVPNATFSVVGIGNPTFRSRTAQDLRTNKMNPEVELEWCRAYGKSQMVIGVHGSNMLLPTAFSAGCVEILPRNKNGNIVQDISVKYRDRMQLFLYRFVDEFASPVVVAGTAVSMYEDYQVYRNNNRVNIF